MIVFGLPSGKSGNVQHRLQVTKMPRPARVGKVRSDLREAILAGFDTVSLDQVLSDNDMLRANVAIGPDFASRVNSLIDVARQEGWLIDLCGVLADARVGNERVNSSIAAVQKWLMDQRDNNEVDVQFQPLDHSQKNEGFRYLPLLSILMATAALIGVGVWAFADKIGLTQPSTISTSGPQSPVVRDTKGNVQIEFGKSSQPMNAPLNAPLNAQRPQVPKSAD